MAPAADVEKQWLLAQRVEKQLVTMLKERECKHDDIEGAIQELRIACEVAIFLDIEYATKHKIEQHLWDAHTQINNRYRKIIARYTKDTQKKNHAVEKRKWEKRYVDFLKTSQYFYKGFVQRLASHFDIPAMRKIAHRLQLSVLSANQRIKISQEQESQALFSCHATLLRLGDLSRYRNVIRNKDRSWDVAFAYYSLANDLFPHVGLAYNQMAVISTIDSNHLLVIYHLYRALAIEEPTPMAPGNLSLQFKKILEEWTGTKKILTRGPASDTHNSAYPLVLWFVRLHAKLYKGEEFNGHDELENEVLSQLTVTLKEKSLEGTLDKFVLVNIAAEYFAGERLRENQSTENFQSYHFLLRLNIRMLFMLLQLLQPELAGSEHTPPDVTAGPANQIGGHESITAVTRRILPALRQYSTWLVSRVDIIVNQESNTPIGIHIREMWEMYASTLTMLVAAFPPEHLPSVDYLLEEDATTIGFKPFRDSENCALYTDDENNLKPRTSDPGVSRSHPNVEMLSRVRDLLRDGMVLATNDKYPIQVVDGPSFQFVEAGLPLSSPIVENTSADYLGSSGTQHATVSSGVQGQQQFANGATAYHRTPSVTPSDSHQSMATDVYRMVDDLVTPAAASKAMRLDQGHERSRETSYGINSSTYEAFGNEDQRPQSRHQQNASLFLGSSPFTPQPGELAKVGNIGDRPRTAVRLGNLQLSDSAEQFAAATLHERTTGDGNANRPRSRGFLAAKDLANPTTPSQDKLSKFLEDQLKQQYPSSSSFSQDSSLYQGTPSYGLNHNAVPRNIFRNDSTAYGGESAFDEVGMLQSSIWDGSQPARNRNFMTPPGGQGD